MDHSAAIASELPFEEVGQPEPTPSPPKAMTPAQTAPAPISVQQKMRGFAGLTWGQLVLSALFVLAAIWSMWATSRIFALEDRRVVSVRLAAIVNDFVTAEARSGTPPDQLAPRTRAFMMALDGVLKKRASSGQVVLVGEAVVASSVPDVTADVVADLTKVIKMPVAAALPPAMPSPMPQQLAPIAPAAPVEQPGASPFGPTGLPERNGADPVDGRPQP